MSILHSVRRVSRTSRAILLTITLTSVSACRGDDPTSPSGSNLLCDWSTDFSGGLPSGWIIAPRARVGSVSPNTGIVNGRLQASGTDNDVIIGTQLPSLARADSIVVEYTGNIPIAPSGTGHQVYLLGSFGTLFAAASYSSPGGHVWYLDRYTAAGTSPATTISGPLSGTPTRAGLTTFDNATTEQVYRHRILLTSGQLRWSVTRQGSTSPLQTRTDALSGIALSAMTGFFFQAYHTSPNTLWADDLSVRCFGG